jgi:hypothetical protein
VLENKEKYKKGEETGQCMARIGWWWTKRLDWIELNPIIMDRNDAFLRLRAIERIERRSIVL